MNKGILFYLISIGMIVVPFQLFSMERQDTMDIVTQDRAVSPCSHVNLEKYTFPSGDEVSKSKINDEGVTKNTEYVLNALWKNAHTNGDKVSARAYQIFWDFVHENTSSTPCDSEVIHCLKETGLADSNGIIYDHKIKLMRKSLSPVPREEDYEKK